MTGAVAIANPAPAKKTAITKTPAARLRSGRFGGVEGGAPRRKSVGDRGFLERKNRKHFAEE
jgi:hypothetical protein